MKLDRTVQMRPSKSAKTNGELLFQATRDRDGMSVSICRSDMSAIGRFSADLLYSWVKKEY